MFRPYLLSLHVPCDNVDAHSPVWEVTVQLLCPKQGTASQQTSLQKTPTKYTMERNCLLLLVAICLARLLLDLKGKNKTLSN